MTRTTSSGKREIHSPENDRLDDELKESLRRVGPLTDERRTMASRWAGDLSELLGRWSQEIAGSNIDDERRAMLVIRVEEMWAIRHNMHIDHQLGHARAIQEFLDAVTGLLGKLRFRRYRDDTHFRRAIDDTRHMLPPELSRFPTETWLEAALAWRGFWVTPRGTRQADRYNAYAILFEVMRKHGLTTASSAGNFARNLHLKNYKASPPPPREDEDLRTSMSASARASLFGLQACGKSFPQAKHRKEPQPGLNNMTLLPGSTNDPSRTRHASLARAVLLPGDNLGLVIFPFIIQPIEPMPWPVAAALLVAFAIFRLAVAHLPAASTETTER